MFGQSFIFTHCCVVFFFYSDFPLFLLKSQMIFNWQTDNNNNNNKQTNKQEMRFLAMLPLMIHLICICNEHFDIFTQRCALEVLNSYLKTNKIYFEILDSVVSCRKVLNSVSTKKLFILLQNYR